MRIDPIEQKVLRAVGITLSVVAVLVVSLALYGRYRVFDEQKKVERRREYEVEMARLMEEELLAEGMSQPIVRATLGPPDSIIGVGELSESWYYQDTLNYGAVLLRFERGRLSDFEEQESRQSPGGPSGAPPPG